MKFHLPRHVALLSALLFSLGLPALNAGETPASPAAPAPSPAAPTSGPAFEFRQLFERITAKLKAGHQTEADLADELKGFDTLLAKYADQKTEEVATIAVMKARLYLEVFGDNEHGIALLKKVKTDFPNTKMAGHIDVILAQLEQKAANEARFAVGNVLPAIDEKDLNGQPLSLAALKGKVVLVDFWATWCGPCVGELPNVLAAYKKFHAKGFEIVGISLDKNKDTLTAFLKERGMTWGQYFDGKGWDNKVSQAFGINSIPATYLLGRDGRIVAKDLRGDDLDKNLTALLGP